MNKNTVMNFNRAFSYEPTAAESQLVNELLAVWGKLEPAAAKNPATIRKGIVFGMGLAAALTAGEITLQPVKSKPARKNQQGETPEELPGR